MRIEVNGSAGSLAFDFEALNELHVYDGRAEARDAGFRRILVTEPDHPYTAAWWPPGHGLGYEHTFVHEIADFVRDVATDTAPTPSFADGLQVQQVLDAVERSSADNAAWAKV
jgi:predicted dehydrogenase